MCSEYPDIPIFSPVSDYFLKIKWTLWFKRHELLTLAAKPKRKNEASGQLHLIHTTFLFFFSLLSIWNAKIDQELFSNSKAPKGTKDANQRIPPSILCCGPKHPRHCSWGVPAVGPLGTSASFKATRINDWLRLGYKIIGRNSASSILCGCFATMYFQGKTAEIAVFRMWGGDLSSCLHHHLTVTLRPLPRCRCP